MIRDLRAWEYHSVTFVFHFRGAFRSVFVRTQAHTLVYLGLYICVSVFIEEGGEYTVCAWLHGVWGFTRVHLAVHL